MNARLQRLWWRVLGRDETVPVAECVHFGAWRYGCGAFHPYENYVVGLARGEPAMAVRGRFVEFLQHYRPRDFGAALGTTLEHEHPLWQFPWARRAAPPAWRDDPDSCPDILTHFSPRGIRRARIEEEFGWLERTFDSIRTHGYEPARFGGPLEARRLLAGDGARRFIILDGNHRLSALTALGHSRVVVRCIGAATVHEAALPRWRGVAGGSYTPEDARRILRAYFNGNAAPRTTETPAPILDETARVPA